MRAGIEAKCSMVAAWELLSIPLLDIYVAVSLVSICGTRYSSAIQKPHNPSSRSLQRLRLTSFATRNENEMWRLCRFDRAVRTDRSLLLVGSALGEFFVGSTQVGDRNRHLTCILGYDCSPG